MTKRFEYTDIDGILKEAEAYIVSDFTSTFAVNSPVKTNADGVIDPSLLPPSISATSLTIKRKASEPILKGDAVYSTGSDLVGVADNNTTINKANVLGIALNAANTGEDILILIFGTMTDPIYSVFAVNSVLFLDEFGGITDEKPTQPSRKFLSVIGKSLGGSDILVNVSLPITLGV